MNLSHFIASKIRKAGRKAFASVAIKMAAGSIALGISVLIIAFSVLNGFKRSIRNKIAGFEGHLQVMKFSAGSVYEDAPFILSDSLRSALIRIKGVKRIQTYIRKPALITANGETEGVVLRGISSDFQTADFSHYLKSGGFIQFDDSLSERQIVISKRISDKLNLSVGQDAVVCFVQDPPKIRKLHVVGIYETYLEELDEGMILGSGRLIQKVNNWKSEEYGGVDVFLNTSAASQRQTDWENKIAQHLPYELGVLSAERKYYRLSDWFQLLDKNVLIILVVIMAVAAFNVSAMILIMVTERTNMVGVLRTLGARTSDIVKVFFYNGVRILLPGLLFGNIVGIGFCFIQEYFKVIGLNPENYYLNYVPILINPLTIVFINIGAIAWILILLTVPALSVNKIKLIDALKFT